jgi:hypothetical protein
MFNMMLPKAWTSTTSDAQRRLAGDLATATSVSGACHDHLLDDMNQIGFRKVDAQRPVVRHRRPGDAPTRKRSSASRKEVF